MSFRIWVTFLLFTFSIPITAQDTIQTDTSISQGIKEVYNVNLWLDGGIAAAGFITNYLGLQIVNNRGEIDTTTISGLNPNKIPGIDRGAIRQDINYYGTAEKLSDIGMYGSFALPFTLLIDQAIRSDGWEYILLYLQTQSLTGNLYSWGFAHIPRKRPIVFNPFIPYGQKKWGGNDNSFYSGHTASTAAATFFMAKVLCDYHPEWGNRKFYVYGAASIIPAFVGVMRYKAAKHFPTDIAAGFVSGAFMGIFIPHLHRTNKERKLVISPFSGEFTGMALTYNF